MTTTPEVAALARALHRTQRGHVPLDDLSCCYGPQTNAYYEQWATEVIGATDGWHLAPDAAPTSAEMVKAAASIGYERLIREANEERDVERAARLAAEALSDFIQNERLTFGDEDHPMPCSSIEHEERLQDLNDALRAALRPAAVEATP